MVRWLVNYSGVCGVVLALSALAQPQSPACTSSNTVAAHVVALYQPFMFNRLGTAEPQGMIFALESDVVPMNNPVDQYGNDLLLHVNPSLLKAGQVRLRSDKRPRPLALRVNQGQCLEIHFRNLLGSDPAYLKGSGLDPETNVASIHLSGLDLVKTIQSDGSWVGTNASSLAKPEAKTVSYKIYTYYAPDEGTFILYSTGDIEGKNSAAQMVNGMFGAVNVQPAQAEYYRSQVTRSDLQYATFICGGSAPVCPSLPPGMSLAAKQGTNGPLCATMRTSVFFSSSPSSISAQPTMSNQPVYVLTTTNGSQTADVVVDPANPGYIYALQSAQQAQYYSCSTTNPTATALTANPIMNYAAHYPATLTDGRACYPVLKMADQAYNLQNGACVSAGTGPKLYYSDLTAVISGPNAGAFPATGNPPFNPNYAEPNRTQPYREFTIIYHNPNPVQPFEQFSSAGLANVLGASQDAFAINYGIAGIGAEILANRLGVGPEGNPDAVDLKFEEFFLASWAVGDPAMVVDVPANAQSEVINNSSAHPPCSTTGYSPGCATVSNTLLINETKNNVWQPLTGGLPPQTNIQATKAYYPDDPSNVYHSYMSDHVKFRILHAGVGATHVHHLHAHQWLHSPNSPDSQYLDSQMLIPGASYTLEIDYGGSGNRNHTVGDSIFHCHFYPHFAGGMWSLWRVHDVIEEGTALSTTDLVTPVSGINRVLPDGEIRAGTPIPAIVPMPTLTAMPFPADVQLADALAPGDHRRIQVLTKTGQPASSNPNDYTNPGYPFFVPGVAGHRAPHPPLDFASGVNAQGNTIQLDGGLPRHLVLNGTIYREFHTNWDFTRDFVLYGSNHTLAKGNLVAFELPEAGTAVEQAAMAAHEQFNGGLPPASGAPFAPPDVSAFVGAPVKTLTYKAANIQTDVVINKKGWHFPQQRFITLWSDVQPTIAGSLPPQPLFFRAASGVNVEYWHTNLVPNYYEMDDFEVRTPTDILGQHIHLVKFDVLASDGSSNGFNYEDGTLSPGEVQERIFAINNGSANGLYPFNTANQFYNPTDTPTQLTLHSYVNDYPVPNCNQPCSTSIFGNAPAGQNWNGAQTTIQRWGIDPLCDLNSAGTDPLCIATGSNGFDRTLRTVFTHDHFGPSTHQQAGLYAGLVVEPENSTWSDSTTGQPLYDTIDCYNPANPMVKYPPPPCSGNTYPRTDGGPTTWQANITTSNSTNSYREFLLEFQDLQLSYTNQSISQEGIPVSPLFTNNAVINLSPGVIPANDPVRAIFSGNGITLSSQATVQNPPGGNCTGQLGSIPATWVIADPAPPDMNEQYCVANRTNTASVYLPGMEPGWSDPTHAINSPSGDAPTPTIISSSLNGTYSLNYRNEPVPLRVNPTVSGTPPSWCNRSGTIGSNATDLSYAFSSIWRNDPCLNAQPPAGTAIADGSSFTFPQPLVPTSGPTAAQGTDPFTPILRAYQGDQVQIRTLVGAHVSLHSFHIPGINWMFEPTPAGVISSGTNANYGFRNTQGMGISEHWEMLFNVPYTTTTPVSLAPTSTTPYSTDYVYEADAGTDGVTNGLWGILRAFDPSKPPQGGYPDLQPLPNNVIPPQTPPPLSNPCSGKQPNQSYQVVAISAAEAFSTQSQNVYQAGQLVYNTRGQQENPGGFADPNALMYVNQADLNTSGPAWTLNPNAPVEPLVLRANAGSCIQITLINRLPGPSSPAGTVLSSLLSPQSFATNLLTNPAVFGSTNVPDPANLPVSSSAALIPSLLFYDPNAPSNMGFNVGFNNQVTANNGGQASVTWFAGHADGTPMEAGTVLLEPSDPILQHFTGLAGVMVIEAAGATWQEDANTHAAATVTLQNPVARSDGSTYTQFRELVLMGQNDIQNQNLPVVQGAFNYRSEPFGAKNSTGTPNTYRWPLATTRTLGGAAPPKTLSEAVTLIQQTNHSLTLSSLDRKFNGRVPRAADLADFSPSVHEASKAAALKQHVDPITGRYSNALVMNDKDTDNNSGQPGDPKTPILYTGTGMPVRVHMAFAGGSAVAPGVFTIHGHHWQEEPWTNNSNSLGSNSLSQVFGMEQIVPYQVLNALLDYAGGATLVKGDYLYEMFQQQAISQGGLWGLLRVQDVSVVITQASTTQVSGSVMVKPGTTPPTSVAVTPASGTGCSATVNSNGSWSCSMSSTAGTKVTATTAQGGSYSAIVR